MERGIVKPNERGALIETAQLLLLSVFWVDRVTACECCKKTSAAFEIERDG